MKAADKLIAIALAVGVCFSLAGWSCVFSYPPPFPFGLGWQSLLCCVRCRCSFPKSYICVGAALLPL